MDGWMDGRMMMVDKKYFFIGFQFLRVTEVVSFAQFVFNLNTLMNKPLVFTNVLTIDTYLPT
jgi:hypothetical protein